LTLARAGRYDALTGDRGRSPVIKSDRWIRQMAPEKSMNTTPLPAKIHASEGIAQVLFFEPDEPCLVSSADRQGKYQGQQGIVLPTV
jgi:hypothetical protein